MLQLHETVVLPHFAVLGCQRACYGRICSDQACRASHHWAAGRVARLLNGLPDTPPLQGFSELLETVSVNVGLKVHGQPFLGSTTDLVTAYGNPAGESSSVL